MKIIKLDRGFRCSEFIDLHGKVCSIQESSLATDNAIWLGCDAGTHTKSGDIELCLSRMHLSQEQVAELLPLLQHFVDTGELPNS